MILHVSKNRKPSRLTGHCDNTTVTFISKCFTVQAIFTHFHTHTYTQAFDRDTAFALSHIHSSRERSCFNEGKHPVNSRAEISSLPSGYLLSDLKWEGQICLGHINKNAAKCCMEFIPVFLLSLTNMFSLLPHFPQA